MKEKFTVSILSSLLLNAFNLITNYFLALKLEILLIGIIAFSTSLIGLASLFVQIGLRQIYVQHNAEENFKEYFSVFFFLKSILIVGTYLPLLPIIFFLNFEELVLIYLLLNIISTIITQFAEPFKVNLKSKKKIIKSTFVQFSVDGLKNLLIIITIINIDRISQPLEILGFIQIIVALLNICLILIFSINEFKLGKIKKEILINFLKATKPLIILSIVTIILTNLGKVILDVSFSHEALANYYIIDTYTISFLLLISANISELFQIYFPREFAENQIKNVQDITHTSERYSSILFLSVIIFTLLNGKIIFEIFLPNYIDSVPYLYILVFTPYLAGINRPYTTHLISSKRQHIFSRYQVIKGIIWITLTIIIVPAEIFSVKMFGFGGFGIAYLNLFGWIVDLFFYRYFSKKIGINFNRNIINHIIFAFIALLSTFLFSIFILRNLILNDLIFISINSIISIGIFLLELILFKELTKKDFKFFLNLFKPSDYKRSIVEEIRVK